MEPLEHNEGRAEVLNVEESLPKSVSIHSRGSRAFGKLRVTRRRGICSQYRRGGKAT